METETREGTSVASTSDFQGDYEGTQKVQGKMELTDKVILVPKILKSMHSHISVIRMGARHHLAYLNFSLPSDEAGDPAGSPIHGRDYRN